MYCHKIDTSDELIITPYKRGIKLISPTSVISQNRHSLGDAMRLPCNFFIVNKNSECVVANKLMTDNLALDSVQEVLGKSVLDFCKSEESLLVVQNDKRVLLSEKPLLVDEIRVSDNKIKDHYLSVKLPIYSDVNSVAGILGFSVLLGRQPLAESLVLLSEMGLTNLFYSAKQKFTLKDKSVIDGIMLTERQLQIVNLVVRGFSAQKIGQEIGLSKRTIEHYIDAIKGKLHVTSKAQLIQKIFQEDNQSLV